MATSTGAWADELERHTCRGQAIMIGSQREERRSNRVLFTAPAVIYADGARHLGLVRDFSVSGLFFYTDFEPKCGAILQVTLKLTKSGSKTLTCVGKVIRIARGAHGVAVGVAIQAEGFELRLLDSMTSEVEKNR